MTIYKGQRLVPILRDSHDNEDASLIPRNQCEMSTRVKPSTVNMQIVGR